MDNEELIQYYEALLDYCHDVIPNFEVIIEQFDEMED